MWQPTILAIACGAFLAAGFVKGVTGLGLPTVSVALLTAAIGFNEAVALMLVPSFVTNLWQGATGGALLYVLRRTWALLLAASIGIWFTSGFAAGLDTALLAGLLGLLLCFYSALSLLSPRSPPPGRWEKLLSPLIGLVNGILTGLTGTFVLPSVPYLQALGLPRDVLVQAMGVVFTLSTLVLAASLAGHRLLPVGMQLLSGLALLPAFIGMLIGQRIRRSFSERLFRRVFFIALFLLGAYIVLRSAF